MFWGDEAVCHNSQSASLLSDSGLVMYFKYTPYALILSALHLSHSDAPSRGEAKMCISTHPHSRRQGKNSLEGYTSAKMAARAATPPLSLHFPSKIGVWERTQEKLRAHLRKTRSAPGKN